MKLILLVSLLISLNAEALEYSYKPSPGSFCDEQGFFPKDLFRHMGKYRGSTHWRTKAINKLLDETPNYHKEFQDRRKTREFCDQYATLQGFENRTLSISDSQERYNKLIQKLKKQQTEREELARERAIAPKKIKDLNELIESYEQKITPLHDEYRMWKGKAEKLAEDGKRPFPVIYKMLAKIGDGLYVCVLKYNRSKFVLRDPKGLIKNPRSTYYNTNLIFTGHTQITENGFPVDVYQYDYAGKGSKPHNDWLKNYGDTYKSYNKKRDQAENKIDLLSEKKREAEDELKHYKKIMQST